MVEPDLIVFLDIDGVLQPFTQERFAHIKDVPELCKELERKTNFKYRYSEWLHQPGLSPYDVAAVYYDWNLEAVSYLKRVLDETGAKIVLSSSWREMRSLLAMEALFAIHGIDGYLYDITFCATNVSWSPLRRTDSQYADDHAKYDKYLCVQKFLMEQLHSRYPTQGKWGPCVDFRTMLILEWLDRHPNVRSYVAVDDRDLSYGLGGHFVKTYPCIDEKAFGEMMKWLEVEDGPYGLPDDCHGELLDEFRKDVLPVCETHWKIGPDVSRLHDGRV